MGHASRLNPTSQAYAGPGLVLDALGRELHPGDEILILRDVVRFRVAEIVPFLDPSFPSGTMQITFVVAPYISGRLPNKEFYLVKPSQGVLV